MAPVPYPSDSSAGDDGMLRRCLTSEGDERGVAESELGWDSARSAVTLDCSLGFFLRDSSGVLVPSWLHGWRSMAEGSRARSTSANVLNLPLRPPGRANGQLGPLGGSGSYRSRERLKP